MKTLIVALAAVAGLAAQLPQVSEAADCCSGCGCQCECAMTCHLVRYMKKVTTTCYGCKCEDFCVGGPSCRGCEHDECCCDNCDCGNKDKCGCDHRPDCHFIWHDWCPSDCACLKTRKILTKYELTKEIPAFKWVVQPLCGSCAEKAKLQDKMIPNPPAMPVAPKSASNATTSGDVSYMAPQR